ncbi:MAG: hypothetical protein Nk1A_8870 [Endomicrobiia bacterium]|nr:MAG: hypothetical protein Nk1A_8870 [Endomicrobiia bacterium]
MIKNMKKYSGIKTVSAEPMTRDEAGELGLIRGYNPKNENCPGYRVVYEDGYESWSPRTAFNKAYRPIDGLTFGHAIEALKQGKRVARKGWNGKGMFIFMRPADELHVSFVSKEIKSLPQSVKDYYYQDCVDENGNEFDLEEDDVVKFTAYLCLKAADGTIVNGWLASQTDILSEDWGILE